MVSFHISLASLVLTLLTICAMAYSVVCLAAARNFLRQKGTPALADADHDALPLSILKPLKGCDPNMYEGFRSHCLQDYPGFEIIFGVSSANDEALPMVERLIGEFPQCPIKIVIGPRVLGANGKVSSIVQMLEHARYAHILINDSDIRVPPNYLSDVMREFNPSSSIGSAKVGMVTCFYRAVPSKSLWSRLEALGVSADFIPGALAARLLEGRVRFGLGSTLAIDREALDAIGGMESIVDYLADDYELAIRILNAGYRVVLPRTVVETFLPNYTFAEYFQHQLRWGRTVRSSRPSGYAGLFITFGLLWALAGLVSTKCATLSWLLLATVLLLRGLVLRICAKSILADSIALKNAWLLPLLDLMAPMLWLFSIAGSHIVWRGEKFVLKAGKLRRV